MTDTETAVQTYSAASLHAVLAEMAWERLKLLPPTSAIDTRQLLIEHICRMLGILASDVAYAELFSRLRERTEHDEAGRGEPWRD